jgi:hypothetical protein
MRNDRDIRSAEKASRVRGQAALFISVGGGEMAKAVLHLSSHYW